jgi:hypothetical protein
LWFIEEDVFIPTKHVIDNINNKYPTGDLLCKSNDIVYERKTDWHWELIHKQIKSLPPPYSHSLICAIRVSQKMLHVINHYVSKYKTLFLDEALFTTLALKARLSIVNPSEFSTIDFEHNWKMKDLNKDCLFHPIKNMHQQYAFRKYVRLHLLK